MGWDGIDAYKAALAGWSTRTIEDLPFRHHRKEGERDGARRWRGPLRVGLVLHGLSVLVPRGAGPAPGPKSPPRWRWFPPT